MFRGQHKLTVNSGTSNNGIILMVSCKWFIGLGCFVYDCVYVKYFCYMIRSSLNASNFIALLNILKKVLVGLTDSL